MEQLLSVEDAAKRLGGVSKWTIHAWLSQGRLQRTKVGSRTMIRESELAKVIKDGDKIDRFRLHSSNSGRVEEQSIDRGSEAV
jgi:excisionase family DNA binding protein